MLYDRRLLLTIPAVLMITIVSAAKAGSVSHDPPPAALEIEITDSQLRASVVVRDVVFEAWFGQIPADLPELEMSQLDLVIDQTLQFLAEHYVVQFDQVRVDPKIEDVFYQESLEENHYLGYVAVDLVYELKGKVERIDLRWDWFDEAEEVIVDRVDANVAYETHLTQLVFSAGEPEATWHRPEIAAAPTSLPPPPPPERQTVAIPVYSGGIVLLLVVWMIWTFIASRRSRRSHSSHGDAPARPTSNRRPLAFGGILVGGLLLAISLSGWGRVSFEPPWAAAPTPPTEEDAGRIFASLHRNIYRAFDYEDRDQGYDVLTRSVSDHLIESVYREVFRSLIMQEENGAVSKVRGVSIVESEVKYPDDPRLGDTGFGIRCRWRVTGVVSHAGHSHWRTNEYRAEYRVAALDEGWRIVSAEVLSQERIASDADTNQAD